MALNAQKKILIAVDGSDQSLSVVNYVAETLPPEQLQVVLFHVFNSIPESYWDVESGPELDVWMAKLKGLQLEHERAIKNVMQTASQTLRQHGFRASQVMDRIQHRVSGIARDLLSEAKKGCYLLALGRSGGRIESPPLGSVANKIIGNLDDVPICVVTGTPRYSRILVAIDGSEGSFRAVNFLCGLLDAGNRQVILFHAMRRLGFPELASDDAGSFNDIERLYWRDTRRMIEPSMEDARARLLEAGYKKDNVTIKFVSGVTSRAGALVAEAENAQCGTIFIGRKGVSQVDEFHIGRVCHKVIHRAQDAAVWIAP